MSSSADMFVLTLRWSPDQDPTVLSCDLIHRDFHNRISFSKRAGLFDVFRPQLARALAEIIDSIQHKRQVLSQPDFQVDLPNLVLGGLRLLVSSAKDGARQIIIRFKHFLGSLQDAFAVDIGLRSAVLPHRERVAVEALVDIVGPLLNLADLRRPNLDEREAMAVEKSLEELAQNSYMLRFYTGLLVRYVNECKATGARMTDARTPARLN